MRFFILTLLMVVSFSSCSVVMASRKNGIEVHELQSFRSRGEFISANPQVISTERLESGEIVEVYQFKQATGSAGRAVMHALLDVSSAGIWEVVGTPLEGYYNQSDYFTLRVTYNESDIATRVEIL